MSNANSKLTIEADPMRRKTIQGAEAQSDPEMLEAPDARSHGCNRASRGLAGVIARDLTRRRLLQEAAAATAALTVSGWWISPAGTRASRSVASPNGRVLGFCDRFDDFARERGKAVAAFHEAAKTGANTVRFPLRWDQVQKAELTWDWSAYEPLHEQIVSRDLKALPVVIGCPEWLGDEEKQVAENGLSYPISDRALNAYGEFVVAVLRYFSERGDHIDGVEIWSEPNQAGAGRVASGHFSRMLATAALCVASVNESGSFRSNKTVVSGGLVITSIDSAWTDYFDRFSPQYFPYALGIHPQGESATSSTSVAEYAAEMNRQIMASFDAADSRTDAEIWVTAVGASGKSRWGYNGQAEVIRLVNESLLGRERCRSIIISPLHSAGGLPGEGDEQGHESSPLVDQDWSPRPALKELEAAWSDRG